VLLAAAKVEALIHAANHGCGAAAPLVQPEPITVLKPPGILVVECPAGCGDTIPVPVTITDMLSPGPAKGESCVRFTAEAAELHDYIHNHLRTCRSATSWADVTLERA
jgi:hypothetical protein